MKNSFFFLVFLKQCIYKLVHDYAENVTIIEAEIKIRPYISIINKHTGENWGH